MLSLGGPFKKMGLVKNASLVKILHAGIAELRGHGEALARDIEVLENVERRLKVLVRAGIDMKQRFRLSNLC